MILPLTGLIIAISNSSLNPRKGSNTLAHINSHKSREVLVGAINGFYIQTSCNIKNSTGFYLIKVVEISFDTFLT